MTTYSIIEQVQFTERAIESMRDEFPEMIQEQLQKLKTHLATYNEIETGKRNDEGAVTETENPSCNIQ